MDGKEINRGLSPIIFILLIALLLWSVPYYSEITKTSNLQAQKAVASIHSEGDFIMIPFDVAMDTLVQGSEVVQITANTSQVKFPRDVTLCVISSDKTGNQYFSYLIRDIVELLPEKDRPKMHSEITDASKLAGTKIIRQPKHGQVELDGTRLTYTPHEGFEGKDRFAIQTVYKGQQFTLRYQVDVTFDDPSWNGGDEDCNAPPFKYPDLTNWYNATSLYALLTGAKDALTGFADLSGSALGSTTGNKITLDTDAAGHNWFIDATPYQNEEWLLTSNPNEWVAKPGSEAEGKMDLLSVLLHEYGHVLGLEHEADSHDIMSSVLLPGVRRLPDTATWYALLQRQDGTLALQTSTPITAAALPGEPVIMTVGMTDYLAALSFSLTSG
jgi:hypothetical protein